MMKYPRGVKVSFDAIGCDDARESVISWRQSRTVRGAWAVLFFAIFSSLPIYGLWKSWRLYQLCQVPTTISVCVNDAWPLLIPISLAMIVITIWMACGTATLRLVGGRGCFTVGIGKLCRRTEFALTSSTQVMVECRKEWEQTPKGSGYRKVWTHEIVVSEGRYSSVCFGKILPRAVQDFMCDCLSRAASGMPLVDEGADTTEPCIRHPLIFTICLVLFLGVSIKSFSGFERLTIADGNLTIARNSWFGLTSECAQISCSKIASVVAANEQTNQKRCKNSWVLEIRNKNGDVLGRTQPIGPHILEWKNRLNASIQLRNGATFDDFHLTTLGLAPLTLIPVTIWLIFSGICTLSMPVDPDFEDRLSSLASKKADFKKVKPIRKVTRCGSARA